MNNLADLLAQLDPDSNIKGTQFEYICKWFLENDRRFRHLTQVWLWDDWPGRWGIDAGIDLVAEDNKGRLWAIQSKAYKSTYSIKKKDVDTFLSESNRAVISHRLLIATTDRIGDTGERAINNQEKPVTFFGLTKLEKSQVNWPASISDLQAPPLPPKEPRDYQIEAINAVVNGFTKTDRGQMIMACGTGKTLTALFAKEKLGADRTLVLAPSLSLLSQLLTEWTANATTAFEYLPVCSDETVGDSIVVSASELGDVTTNPVEIADFLRKPGPRTVFSTYQSSPEIAKAFELGRVKPFDLVVADEAHRTVGLRSTTAFATVLDNGKIPAKRRLFMTATPRFVAGSVIGEVETLGHEVASMDNETKYGPVFHRLAFAEAIERGLLTDYQVVVIGVDDVECRELADKARWVQADDLGNTDGRTLAAQIGLAKAMTRHDLRRAISFHSRVTGARRFSHSLPEVVSWIPDDVRPSGEVWANYVSGEMTAKQRNVRLRELGTIDAEHRGLLSNARCLTEGVDVPTLDGVVFIDPKRSEVDIVQAVGRAIRLAPDKTVGTIVIPVFMASGEDHEVILDDSAFKTVWAVVRALRMHDEELAEQLDSLRLGLGYRGASQPRLPEKIHLDLPTHISADFARAFDVRLVDSVTAPWLEWYGMLQAHFQEKGTTDIPPSLNIWMNNQRSLRKRGKLSADRIKMLDDLDDWSWEPQSDAWQKFVDRLQEHFEATGSTRVLKSDKSYNAWLDRRIRQARQQYRRGELSPERIEQLGKIGDWSWKPHSSKFEKFVEELQKYYDHHGTTIVEQRYTTPDGYALGTTIARIRYRKDNLSAEQIAILEGIGDWTWDALDAKWQQRFEELREGGTAYFPKDHLLADWVGIQRTWYRQGKLTAERIKKLNSLSFWTWDVFDERWENMLRWAVKYCQDNGTVYAPPEYRTPEGFSLYGWNRNQVRLYKQGKLSAERIKKLERIGDWSWEPPRRKPRKK